MTTQVAVRTRPQVFLSFAAADRGLAAEVADLLSRAGLSVVRMDDLEPAGEYSNAVRKALRKSSAMVVVLSGLSRQREIPASVLFEIGAASGADKPIFLVVDEPSSRLPFHVPDLMVLPVNRVAEIAHHLERASD